MIDQEKTMKFRDPKTGEVFDVEREGATGGFCAHINCCSNCPLPECAKEYDCSDWIIAHPAEAARRMGYEVVEETFAERLEASVRKDEDNMETTDKPRICEVLGVEVGERFGVRGSTSAYIDEKGIVRWDDNDIMNPVHICDLINDTTRILRKPRFTEEEAADAKAAVRFFKAAHSVRRSNTCDITLADRGGLWIAYLPNELFPSLLPGQSVKLEEVTGA